MTTVLKEHVIKRMNNTEDRTKDFPYDIILQEFARMEISVDGVDGDLVGLAVKYYDRKTDKDIIISETRKLLEENTDES